MDTRRSSLPALAALVAVLLPLSACSQAIPRGPGPAPLSGVVRDTLGAPLAGVDVRAWTLQEQGGSIEEASGTTKNDGTFDFGLVTRTEWVVLAAGAVRVAIDTVTAPATGVALVLRAPGAARGRVRVTGLTSYEGIIVTDDTALGTALTDSLGTYELDGLPAGERALAFLRLASGALRTTRILVRAPGDTVTVPDIVFP